MNLKTIFGPIPSRRFGISLGIDLSPDVKQCNFDCLYCELSPAITTDSYSQVIPPEQVLSELDEALNQYGQLDVITLTANGEPTLYPHLEEVIAGVNARKGSAKSLILSNGSTINRADIRQILLNLDIVKLSLDCVSDACFKRLDRASKSLDLQSIIEGMVTFREMYTGALVLETLFVENLNDKEEETALLAEAMRKIRPDRVDLSSIDRPPAYEVKRISDARLHEIAHQFEGIPVFVASRNREKLKPFELDEEDILHTLSRRPLTWEDMQYRFSEETLKRVRRLVQEGTLGTKKVGNVEFFVLPLDK